MRKKCALEKHHRTHNRNNFNHNKIYWDLFLCLSSQRRFVFRVYRKIASKLANGKSPNIACGWMYETNAKKGHKQNVVEFEFGMHEIELIHPRKWRVGAEWAAYTTRCRTFSRQIAFSTHLRGGPISDRHEYWLVLSGSLASSLVLLDDQCKNGLVSAGYLFLVAPGAWYFLSCCPQASTAQYVTW